MIGAIIGDVIGSTREFSPVDRHDFELFPEGSDSTDDSLMTIAQGLAFRDFLAMTFRERTDQHLKAMLISRMKEIGRRFPNPTGSYGQRFGLWLRLKNSEAYNSWGNGSAMRVSAAAESATSLEEALHFAQISAAVTHNHPEGIKGAQAVAAAIYLARAGESVEAIAECISRNFYPLTRSLAEIKPTYHFDESCQATVPESIQAFVEATSFEDAIRNTVWLGGDADTMGAITGSIAWAYYERNGGIDEQMRLMTLNALAVLPDELRIVVTEYEDKLAKRRFSLG